MARLEPPERWTYGGLAVAFVVSNIGIVLFGWTEFWQYMAINVLIVVATLALFSWHYRGSDERSS
jgi:predicted ABC-type sugar transport system permease subunit